MKIEQTSAINGVFVMLVFLSHFRQYITNGKFELLFNVFFSKTGQVIVTTFLFYSGYGIMYSMMNKKGYVATIPKRFLKVLIHFDIAVFIYLIIDISIGKQYPIHEVLLAFTGWTSIGNSSWYIFAILCMYIITFISGRICKENYHSLAVFVMLGCCIYSLLVYIGGKPLYMYDTICCFSAGMFYAVYFDRIKLTINKNSLRSVLSSIVLFVACIICYLISRKINSFYIIVILLELRHVFFALFIVAVTSFLRIVNPVLLWLGNIVFEIYILQRIPMILLQYKIHNKYLYFVICVIITGLLTIIFKRLEERIDRLLID